MSLFGYLGIGTGYLGQSFSGTFKNNSEKANIFVNLNYAPVLDFGIGTKVHLLEDRLLLGLSIGGKFIIDSSPESYIYSNNTINNNDGNEGTTTEGYISVGAIVGKNFENGQVINCYNEITNGV